MKLTPCELPEAYRKTKLQVALEEFSAMDAETVRVDTSGYATAGSAASALQKAAERYGFLNIRAFVFDGEAYMTKER